MSKGTERLFVAGNENPVTVLATKFNEFEIFFKKWVVRQSLPVEAVVVTLSNSVKGAALSIIWNAFSHYIRSTFYFPPPRVITSSKVDTISDYVRSSFSFPPQITPLHLSLQKVQLPLLGRRLIEARNMAVWMGVNEGVKCVMRRLRGKEDVQTSMVAGFCAGFMFSLVQGDQPARLVSCGVLFALANGGLFKAAEKLSQTKAENRLYNKTRGMLSYLGLNQYENNFKKGLLDDTILSSLTDSDMQEVKIPRRARKRILDHIKREKKAQQEGLRWT